jgi:hypothetical protein
MSVANPYLTFKNIQDAVIVDSKSGEAARDQVKRFINQGYMDLIARRKREFLDVTINYALQAKRSGRCVATQNSTTIQWTDTSTALLPVTSGAQYKFFVGGTEEIYDVVSFTSSVINLDLGYVKSTLTSAVGTLVQASIPISDTIKTVSQIMHDYYPYPVKMVGPQELDATEDVQGRQQTGYARYATVRQKTASGQSRLFVYPYPSERYIVKLQGSKYFTQLTADADEPLIPVEYRQILYFYAMSQIFKTQRNQVWYGDAMQNYQLWLGRMDSELFPSQDEPSMVWDYTNRFISPFMRYRNSNRLGPDEE